MSLSRKFKRSKVAPNTRSFPKVRAMHCAAPVQDEATRMATAVHEAAHAVVGVRLGMTLRQVEIRTRLETNAAGQLTLSSGITTYLVNGLADKLSVPEAYRARAIFAAAGFVAEKFLGNEDRIAVLDDLHGIRRFAQALGMHDHPSDKVFVAFFASVLNEASCLLFKDGGSAWNRVAQELVQHLTISPERVVDLVG